LYIIIIIIIKKKNKVISGVYLGPRMKIKLLILQKKKRLKKRRRVTRPMPMKKIGVKKTIKN